MMLTLKQALLGSVVLGLLSTGVVVAADYPHIVSGKPTATTSTFRLYNDMDQEVAVRVDSNPPLQVDAVLGKTVSAFYSLSPGTYNVEINHTANQVEFKAGQSYLLMQNADGTLKALPGDTYLPKSVPQ